MSLRAGCAALAFLAAGTVGCGHGDGGHPVAARISGEVEMVGGPYPGVHSPPHRFDVLVTDTARRRLWEQSGGRNVFSFMLSKGDYQVSVRDGAVACGGPQDVSVHSSKTIALSFVCAMK